VSAAPRRNAVPRRQVRPVEGLTVEVAGESDLDAVLDILQATKGGAGTDGGAGAGGGRYAPGSVTWGRDFPDVARDLPAGLVHLARLDGRPAGTFVLRWSDEAVWGPDDGEAGYLHRLATHPDVAGRGIGIALVSFAAGLIRRRGRNVLRLDCNRDNDRLRAYYEAQGFTHAGDADVRRITRPGYRSTSRYERPVGD
jgi:GNAT superfamily N-acetyltransferase